LENLELIWKSKSTKSTKTLNLLISISLNTNRMLSVGIRFSTIFLVVFISYVCCDPLIPISLNIGFARVETVIDIGALFKGFSHKGASPLPATATCRDTYDIVVNADSVAHLLKGGHWEITVGSSSGSNIMHNENGMKGPFVAVTGIYNKGKTWFCNRLTNSNLCAGFAVPTKGISIKSVDLGDNNIVVLSTQLANKLPWMFLAKMLITIE